MLHPRSLDKPLAAVIARLPDSVLPVMTFASFIAAAPAIAVIHVLVVSGALVAGNESLLRVSLLAVLLRLLPSLRQQLLL